MPEIRDAAQRARALDTTRSFIVQAPAGSGKTGLLIQRYLALLARVEKPEAVVAITFTRKAAGEMRRRVLDALAGAAQPEPAEPHNALTWRLARAVSERDAGLGWDLSRNTSRLSIRTIDSLCDSLVRRMPWLSRLGAPPQIIEDARALYQEAARRTIDLVEVDAYQPCLARILLHVDNDYTALADFLAGMLSRRDQWLRHLAGVTDAPAVRAVLEGGMRNVIAEALEAVCQAAPEFLATELPPLARHAAGNVEDGHIISRCAALRGQPDDLPTWLGVGELLLTREGSWRSRFDVRLGLPPSSRAEKNRLGQLVLRLDDEFRERLAALRALPPETFEDSQWEVLEALIPALKLAAAQLRMLFRERGQTDFIEIAAAATNALSEEEAPTDLALALDYRIEHLLIDEFQDTSVTQYRLIEKLVAGWEPADGRTLLLVGDPMQSIFRFREAEVTLFLRAARDGIGPVKLERLQLESNFRSEQGIVEWVNQVFPNVLPADDIAAGAVRFASSAAVQIAGSGPAVTVHPFFDDDDQGEAARVVEIIRAAGPAEKIAVLVRARTHLESILQALRRAGLKYRATEIDELGEVAITQDLLTLTRALLHPADRVAWLALLRAPWCGLTLADLHALAGGDLSASVWDLMRDGARVVEMSADGQARLERVRTVLESALVRRGSRLRPWIEGCWIALGGPACATEPGEAENAREFLRLLEEQDEGGDVSIDVLAEKAGMLFAASDPEAGERLQVMTIHKAKGLEFDIVLVPGLGRSVKGDDPKLLAWLERPNDLLLAPVKAAGAGKDQLSEYVKSIERQKRENEEARLLYVAATRARKQLHLLGAAAHTQKGLGAKGLLSHLWDAVEGEFIKEDRAPALAVALPQPTAIPPAPLRRLPSGWSLPAPPASATAGEMESAGIAAEPPTFEWVGDTLRHIGTVVHQMFARIGREGLALWGQQRVEASMGAVETALRSLGVPAVELPQAAATVRRAIETTLADERGRWILENSHGEARSEYAVTGLHDGRVKAARVDRTFVDAQGVRWIIDFKTSEHAGGDREGFLDNELERYRGQLAGYRTLFSAFDGKPVRIGLYFPLFAGWREYLEAATA